MERPRGALHWGTKNHGPRKDRGSNEVLLVAGQDLNLRPLDAIKGVADNYAVGPETTDSLGVVRDSPSLPVSGYPSSTGHYGINLDS